MATCRVQVALTMESGIPEDRVVNTFHIQTPTTPVWTGTNSFMSALKTCWTAFSIWYPTTVAQDGHEVKVYDLADPEPRAPIFSEVFDFPVAPDGNPLPSEVAMCVSYQAARVSGEDQKRRRGRIYVGPLSTPALETNGRPDPTMMEDLGQAWEVFIETLESVNTIFVGIWSRVGEELVYPIEDGWVDNAFDIQRRRGLAPTVRETFNITH